MTEAKVSLENVYSEPRNPEDKENKEQRPKKQYKKDREYKPKRPETDSDDGLDSDGFEIQGAEKKKKESRGEYQPKKRFNNNRNFDNKDRKGKKFTKRQPSADKEEKPEVEKIEEVADGEAKKKVDKATVKLDGNVKKLKDIFG
jgi:hypothetical protein